MKHCRYCQRLLPPEAFTVRRASPDGLSLKCRECARSYHQTRYHSNTEVRQAAKKRAKNWAQLNPERRKEVAGKHAEKTREKKNARTRQRNKERRAANPELCRLQDRVAAHRRRIRGLSAGKMDREAVQIIMRMARDKCLYCQEPCRSLTIDHLEAISTGGDNCWSNLVPCCKQCNSSKSNSEFSDWIHRRLGISGLARVLMFVVAVRKAIRRLRPDLYVAWHNRNVDLIDRDDAIEIREV